VRIREDMKKVLVVEDKMEAREVLVRLLKEIDEGTAIFKCAVDVPIPRTGSIFVPSDADSDHYLRIVGEASKALKMNFTEK